MNYEETHVEQVPSDVTAASADGTYKIRSRKRVLTLEQKAELLSSRARRLAQDGQKQTAEEASLRVVEFVLAQESYAIEAIFVREVVHLKELNMLPGAPPYVAGIINVRGLMLAVIDLKTLFASQRDDVVDRDTVVIIHGNGKELGILADDIRGVRSIPFSALHPAPSTFAGVQAECIRGVTSEHLVVLQADKLLAGQDIAGQNPRSIAHDA